MSVFGDIFGLLFGNGSLDYRLSAKIDEIRQRMTELSEQIDRSRAGDTASLGPYRTAGQTAEQALIEEGLRHDAAMTPGPWKSWMVAQPGMLPAHLERDENAEGMAWLRTNIRKILTGYRAALGEVDRLTGQRDRHLLRIRRSVPAQNVDDERNDDVLHAEEAHPDFQYLRSKGAEGDGWVVNMHLQVIGWYCWMRRRVG